MNRNKYICIHGHFYQPPRENPWLESIQLQDSAYPFHDWNERISEECYKVNASSRILDKKGNILSIVNNYTDISFNFGPTLLSWMEKNQPETYQTILESDRISQKKFSGHGSAIAQPYNHMIMPLANSRDKLTQIYWGLKDFQKRFGRDPEGMWLPETAVDYETLENMADLGIRYTLLAPHQASRIKKINDDGHWQEIFDAQLDVKQPYLCLLPSGKTICIFFYNGSLAHGISFGDLLRNGENFAKRLLEHFSPQNNTPELVHLATDGETFGHHHRFGDMALAYCLNYIQENQLARITNYGEYLSLYPPSYQVQIVENTSWSCVHGIERWKDHCGCHSGSHVNWQQHWRKPLRTAMNWLRDQVADLFEKGAGLYFEDPWKTRNEYISIVLNRNQDDLHRFFNQQSKQPLKENGMIQAIKYLEMQRNAMLMFTSCGWFFDEISRIETLQILQYAARCIQLTKELSQINLETEFINRLKSATSNIPEYENGEKIYQNYIQPEVVNILRVGAHYAISSLFNGRQKSVYSYQILRDQMENRQNGQLKMAIGRATIQSQITLEQEVISFAVIHLGGHNVNGGVRSFTEEESFQKMYQEISTSFDQADIPGTIRLMDKHFGTNSYSLWHLFKDEQRKVIRKIMEPGLEQAETCFIQSYLNHRSMIHFLKQLNIPIPPSLSVMIQQAINHQFHQLFTGKQMEIQKLQDLIKEIRYWDVHLDHLLISFQINHWVNHYLEKISKKPGDIHQITELNSVLNLLKGMDIRLHLWKAQNIYFRIKQNIQADNLDLLTVEKRNEWLDQFKQLGALLNIGMNE